MGNDNKKERMSRCAPYFCVVWLGYRDSNPNYLIQRQVVTIASHHRFVYA